jgi:hypothetical protein
MVKINCSLKSIQSKLFHHRAPGAPAVFSRVLRCPVPSGPRCASSCATLLSHGPRGAHATRRPLRLAVVREKVPTRSQQRSMRPPPGRRYSVRRRQPRHHLLCAAGCRKDAPREHGIMTAAPLHCAHLNCRCGDIASGRPPPRVPMTTLLSCDCVARALTGGSKVLRGLAHACGCGAAGTISSSVAPAWTQAARGRPCPASAPGHLPPEALIGFASAAARRARDAAESPAGGGRAHRQPRAQPASAAKRHAGWPSSPTSPCGGAL